MIDLLALATDAAVGWRLLVDALVLGLVAGAVGLAVAALGGIRRGD